ncbi:Prohibitin-1, subunit of the prohibitin complex (Phb1p-Phb2p) [Malassezia caprae]|uniref:Prohibitin-1, subunit of the prohibitin complex (Phb1p-Phb2p) n=1 Tax=Malassezia caprae TaxID=1381934 RepID=A0AAF0E4K8_9BASI|nr:Prohibitin-1, subunit of the prohibitin complex (Phb1p-Phb2p) [Malassezia caprae]
MNTAANFLSRFAVPLGMSALAIQASMYDVPGGYRAVMFDRFAGVKDRATNEGTHFLVPWLQRAILYDVRIKPRTISTTTGSKDLQMVTLSLRVLSRPDVAHLPKIYQSLGLDYDERVLPSIGNEVLKATVAQFDAAELITQREVVSARIREDLLNRAREFNIVLEDVSITHLTFGQEFTKAVEQKQIAQQDAERAKFVVEKAEQERQASVIRAEGEAEGAGLITRALDKAGDGLLTMRRIEASQQIAKTLSGAKNVSYLPSSGNILESNPPAAHLRFLRASMRLNEHTVLRGERVVLVPYSREHVETYHAWMQDPALQAQTASEPLTLDEEYAMQQSWRDDDDKLTFIVLALARDVPRDADTSTLLSACAMAGDVNVFLTPRFSDDEDAPPNTYAEMEVMIAEHAWRRRGLGREALQMLLHYITQAAGPPFPLDPTRLFARISMENAPSIALFEQLGFQAVKENTVFEEVEMAVVDAARLRTTAPVAVLTWP